MNPLSMVVTVNGVKVRFYTEREIVAWCFAMGYFDKQPEPLVLPEAA